MSGIAPTLQLLYRLIFDGGYILSCNQDRYGEYVVEIEPNPAFDFDEVKTRYGNYSPFHIMLVPSCMDAEFKRLNIHKYIQIYTNIYRGNKFGIIR